MSEILSGKILDSSVLNGVSVVTSIADGKKGGCTVSWFAQVSFTPVLLMISLTQQRHTYSVIQKSSLFNVSILADDQISIGRHFGLNSGHTKDKFSEISFENGTNGAPLISEAKAHCECRLIKTVCAGDHNLLIGEITRFSENSKKNALLFKGADYW